MAKETRRWQHSKDRWYHRGRQWKREELKYEERKKDGGHGNLSMARKTMVEQRGKAKKRL